MHIAPSAAKVSRPGVPPKSTEPPASSARTVRRHSRISASVAARRPMVLAEV